MIPKTNDDLRKDFQFGELPTNTYRLNIKQNAIAGFIQDRQAMVQAIYLILNVERYEHLIYSWNYGIELTGLFGKSIPFVMSELPGRIREALLQDTRIKEVDNFQFERDKNKVQVTFTARTIFGDIEAEKVVII